MHHTQTASYSISVNDQRTTSTVLACYDNDFRDLVLRIINNPPPSSPSRVQVSIVRGRLTHAQ